jgi:hypothetical protein
VSLDGEASTYHRSCQGDPPSAGLGRSNRHSPLSPPMTSPWSAGTQSPSDSAYGTLDLDCLHQTRGDPGAGPSNQAPEQIPNPRVRFLQRPPSPSLAPPTYWTMEPSTQQLLREVVGSHLAPSTVWAHALTQLHQGGRCCHH